MKIRFQVHNSHQVQYYLLLLRTSTYYKFIL